MDPGKVKDVLEWKPPQRMLESKSFLVLAGYYHRFIENFSKIAKLLTALLEKGKYFKCTDACQNNFEELKKRLTTEPMLATPAITRILIYIVILLVKVWVVCLSKKAEL